MAASAPTNPSEPISLDQAKKHLRVVFDDENDYISSLITAARQMAEGALNRTLMQRALIATFDSMDTRFWLRKPPIISVESIMVTDRYFADSELDADAYKLTPSADGMLIRPGNGSTWLTTVQGGGTLTVQYTAGYEPGTVPAPIIQWMLLCIGTMYENRETMSAGVQIYDMPEDFMRWLLQPYMVYE